MPRNDETMHRHEHGGSGLLFGGIVLVLLGLLLYYNLFSWPLIFVVIGVLAILGGLFKMAKKDRR